MDGFQITQFQLTVATIFVCSRKLRAWSDCNNWALSFERILRCSSCVHWGTRAKTCSSFNGVSAESSLRFWIWGKEVRTRGKGNKHMAASNRSMKMWWSYIESTTEWNARRWKQEHQQQTVFFIAKFNNQSLPWRIYAAASTQHRQPTRSNNHAYTQLRVTATYLLTRRSSLWWHMGPRRFRNYTG